jgi:glycosyltransferase involved in cell wall biosynthesis
MTSLLFSWYLKAKGIPSVFHTPGPITLKWFFKFNSSALYLANSYDTEKRIYNFTGRHADGVVTPGVPIPQEYPRKSIDISCPILLSVSRFSRAKGVYRLLEIFYYVKEELPQAQLLLVGKNYEGEGIVNKAKELGIEKDIQLVGQVPYSEIGKYYSKADIFIHPSYPESFGMVLLEAMSYGVPVVASDLPCFRESTKGAASLLFHHGSFDWQKENYMLWAKEIINILRNPEKRIKMSEDGKIVAQSQTWKEKAKEYEGFLFEAVKRK